jgi:uncharacterized protein YvpB
MKMKKDMPMITDTMGVKYLRLKRINKILFSNHSTVLTGYQNETDYMD